MASSTLLVGDSFALSMNCGVANWRPKRNGSEQNAMFLRHPGRGRLGYADGYAVELSIPLAEQYGPWRNRGRRVSGAGVSRHGSTP